jgi:hypothetical protein
LDKPIAVGATRVTGRGPEDVPIVLMDITFAGPVLATGEIDGNGEFELMLNEPLEAEHRIGLSLGDLSGSKWQAADFSSDFNGDEAINIPQIGFFFDSYMIRE